MSRLDALGVAFTVLLAVVIVWQYTQVVHTATQAKQQYVYDVCTNARQHLATFQACGQAQDDTQTEYLCNHNLTSCRVESK